MVEAAFHIKAIMSGIMLVLIYLYSTFQVVYKTIKFFKLLGVEKRDRALLRLAEVGINSFILTTITLGLMYDGPRVIGLGAVTLISSLVLVIYLYRTRTKLNNILGYFERREVLLCAQIHDLRNRNLKIRKSLPDKFKH